MVKLYEVLDDPTVDKLYIIMEYVKYGTLLGRLSKQKAILQTQVWKYFRDILSGLHYCKDYHY